MGKYYHIIVWSKREIFFTSCNDNEWNKSHAGVSLDEHSKSGLAQLKKILGAVNCINSSLKEEWSNDNNKNIMCQMMNYGSNALMVK